MSKPDQRHAFVAPRMAKIKEGIDKGEYFDLDISSELTSAMQKLSSLRESGQTVDNYLRQMSLQEDLTPLAKDILQVFDKNKRSAKRISAILQAYADGVELSGNPNQQTIFAQNAPSKAEIWTRAVRKAEGLDGLTNLTLQSQEWVIRKDRRREGRRNRKGRRETRQQWLKWAEVISCRRYQYPDRPKHPL